MSFSDCAAVWKYVLFSGKAEMKEEGLKMRSIATTRLKLSALQL